MSNKRKCEVCNWHTKFPRKLPPNFADESWKLIEDTIRQMYDNTSNDTGLCITETWRKAYHMGRLNLGEKMYSGLVTTMTSLLKDTAKSIEAAQGCSFLKELNTKWIVHNEALQIIRIILNLDRLCVPGTQKAPVGELGLNLWREIVIYSSQIRTRVLNALLELVHSERNGEVIDRGMMRNTTKMLMDLGPYVYEHEFETHFLQASAEFYRAESQKLIECCDCGDYLKKVERRLNEEMERVSHYLDPMTEKKIVNVVEKEMIENHMHKLIHMENPGLVHMFRDDNYEDLGRMYNLFRRVTNGLSGIQQVMTEHIKEFGRWLANDPEKLKDRLEFEQRLLDEKNKYDKIINLAFSKDESFQNALKSSFEYSINLNTLSPALISLFLDDKLERSKGI